jgi:hypothetical protein
LPWLAHKRTTTIQGAPSVRLEDWRAAAPFTVDAATIAANTQPSFPLPPPQS